MDAIDAAHNAVRETPSGLVGNTFRIEVAERLETQERTNRGWMYHVFAEIADPPDGVGAIADARSALWSHPDEMLRGDPDPPDPLAP